jgi:hypothetical protein
MEEGDHSNLRDPAHQCSLPEDTLVSTQPVPLLTLVIPDPTTRTFLVFTLLGHQSLALKLRPVIDVAGGVSNMVAVRLGF